MAKVIGDTIINKPAVEGILSGGGDVHRTENKVAKAGTDIEKFAVVVTPRDSAHADAGLVTPLSGSTDFSTHRIAGITSVAYLADGTLGEKICTWTKGGFKSSLVADGDTLITADVEHECEKQGIYFNKLVK